MVVLPIERSWVFLCDECRAKTETAQNGVDLRLPWRAFSIFGWVGAFHACSAECEGQIRGRYERP